MENFASRSVARFDLARACVESHLGSDWMVRRTTHDKRGSNGRDGMDRWQTMAKWSLESLGGMEVRWTMRKKPGGDSSALQMRPCAARCPFWKVAGTFGSPKPPVANSLTAHLVHCILLSRVPQRPQRPRSANGRYPGLVSAG